VDRESALWLINCALFSSFYKNLNHGSKLKYKEFLVQVAKAWATDEMEAAQTQSDTDSVQPRPSTHTPHRPHVGDFLVICGNMSSGKA
jgi:hypothetical protein